MDAIVVENLTTYTEISVYDETGKNVVSYFPRSSTKRPPKLIRHNVILDKPPVFCRKIPVSIQSMPFVQWPKLNEKTEAVIVPPAIGEYYMYNIEQPLPQNVKILLGMDLSPASVIKNAQNKIKGVQKFVVYRGDIEQYESKEMTFYVE